MYSHKDHCLKFGDLIITHTLIIYLNHDFTPLEFSDGQFPVQKKISKFRLLSLM
jgi:hypothetical protein